MTFSSTRGGLAKRDVLSLRGEYGQGCSFSIPYSGDGARLLYSVRLGVIPSLEDAFIPEFWGAGFAFLAKGFGI